MKINKSEYDESKSQGIGLVVQDQEIYEDVKKIYEFRHSLKLSSIEMFKLFFGKQQTCRNYTSKNWIWTFSDDEEKNVIYCLVSKEGISWETPNSKEIKPLFKEIFKKFTEKFGEHK
ncbi:MAG: hypothetical protein EKK64_00565 [Neisseriaceae bacterium]|nr:MAG: hypothetical protein EKK64_00565 [Neisseriaceae bacterium]